MIHRRRALAGATLLVFGIMGSAHAATVTRPVIESPVIRAARSGIVSIDALKRTPGHAPVVIELVRPADDAAIAELRKAGVELSFVDGRALSYDRFVPAHVSEASANALRSSAIVRRVSLAPAQRIQPLDHSAELVRLDDGRGARPALDRLTGAGMVIGDVDSLIDVFEPAFFRADGGYFDWVDVDSDGVFTPGVDAIDLDGDGKITPEEKAVLLRAATFERLTEVSTRPNDFDPGFDWVFLDTNGNGARDYGTAAGFDDTTPAFGEPLFVPDDVNRNGKIDPGERFVQLSSSKIAKVRVHVALGNPTDLDHVFARGTDLSKTPTDITGGMLYGFGDAIHATGALAIAAGDVPLVGRKWVGMAPDADLVVAFDVDNSGASVPTDATAWALGQKPNVMLYELAPWTGLPLDGSDPLSQIIDASTMKDGVIHTCPTGDQAAAHKHGHAIAAAGATATLPFVLPETTKSGAGPFAFVQLSVHVRGGTAQTVTLFQPDGQSVVLKDGAQKKLPSGATYYSTIQTSERGTQLFDVYLFTDSTAPSPAPLPIGNWHVDVAAGPTTPITVDGYLADDVSSWALGVGWIDPVVTDDSTIAVPSVADHCIAVGAAPDHIEASSEPWYRMFYPAYDVPDGFVETQDQVRAYSPRGPRLDGAVKPDILAPDNPWVPLARVLGDTSATPFGAYWVFGGTSGASPHVTGIAALLAQAGLKGDAARDAIRHGARTDGSMGTLPNGAYGYGHIDVAKALGVTTEGVTPTITIAPTFSANVGDAIDLTAVIAGGDGFEIRWDDGYDGTWDTDYAAPAPHKITSKTRTKIPVKIRARNASGRIAEAITTVTFDDPAPSSCGCRLAGGSTPAVFGLGSGLAFVLARTLRRRRSV